MLRLLMCLFGLHGATEIDYTVDDEEIKVCRGCLNEVEYTLATSVAFAERITAYKTPLNMHYWRGFSFLIGGEYAIKSNWFGYGYGFYGNDDE